jgi:cyclophilin family peptidyl-prolyl cis-trans isomerase
MLRSVAVLLFLAAGVFLALGAPSPAIAAPGPCTVDAQLGNPVEIVLHTSAGDIGLELWPDVAPCTINNFLAYVDSGRFDGTFIHRAVDNFVIQGGGYSYDSGTDIFSAVVSDPPVVNEPGASNVAGTIAMARVGGQVNSATSEFFINLADNSFLDTVDQGFTVFGEVVTPGMTIADDIDDLPTIDGRFAVNSELREAFTDLPLHSLPSEPQSGYGCFDSAAVPEIGLGGWIRALVNEAVTALELDPLTGGLFYLSRSCDGLGAVGPPSVPCSVDREVAYSNGSGWFLDPTTMTCDAIAESEESVAARRDDQHSQVGANVVEVTGVTVTVPEPGAVVSYLAGALGLSFLRRLRNRTNP